MDGVNNKEESLPPGFRFHPTDEELITYYLTHKISDSSFTGRAIADADLNKCEPWDLPGKAKMGEKEWYFFSLRDRKYPTGVRTNRATNAGYWKTTGKDKEIFNSAASSELLLVGMKKTLVFYKGRAPRGEKTNWVMHEYRLQPKSTSLKNSKDEWVVCRIFQKSSGSKKFPTNQSRGSNNNNNINNINNIPYHLEMAPGGIMPSVVIQAGDPYHMGGGIGRSYAELAELARVLRGNPPAGMMNNFPMQPQVNYSGGSFTLSGLNLNLGGAPPPPAPAPVLRMPAPSPPQPQQVAGDMPSSTLTGCILTVADTGFGTDVNHHHAVNRFQNMDSCVDLESYWPSY